MSKPGIASNRAALERVRRSGADRLSDAELLAAFFPGETAQEDALRLLREAGSLQALLRQRKVTAAGRKHGAAFARLQAGLELAQRVMFEGVRDSAQPNKMQMTAPRKSIAYIRSKLTGLDHEVFACLFLDTRHRIIMYEEMFHGTIDRTSGHPREVMKRALYHGAAAVLFAHNHPSGDTEPSRSDEEITRKLQEALRLIDVRVIDHIIVGDGCPLSFAEQGLL